MRIGKGFGISVELREAADFCSFSLCFRFAPLLCGRSMLRWWRGGAEIEGFEMKEIFRGNWGHVVIRRSRQQLLMIFWLISRVTVYPPGKRGFLAPAMTSQG